uniref:8 kDa glycoprotein n=1 Tax=Taenia multiceps TaxID=94034 RepID=B6E472_TAEMU|nr:8 kDa glycoprotein [Taenia multiceps]
MRAYIVLLALTVFVVAVSAEEAKPVDVVKSIKNGIEFVHKFFNEDPLGKKIAQLAKDWKEAMVEARGKVRAALAEYIRGLKNEAA